MTLPSLFCLYAAQRGLQNNTSVLDCVDSVRRLLNDKKKTRKVQHSQKIVQNLRTFADRSFTEDVTKPNVRDRFKPNRF